jgi:hypothetical protein
MLKVPYPQKKYLSEIPASIEDGTLPLRIPKTTEEPYAESAVILWIVACPLIALQNLEQIFRLFILIGLAY